MIGITALAATDTVVVVEMGWPSTWRPISVKSAAFSVMMVAPTSRADAAIRISCMKERCVSRARFAACRRMPRSTLAASAHVPMAPIEWPIR